MKEKSVEWIRGDASDMDGQVREGSGRSLWGQTSQFRWEDALVTGHMSLPYDSADIQSHFLPDSINSNPESNLCLNSEYSLLQR